MQRNGFLYAWSHPLSRKEIRRLFALANPASQAEGRGLNRWLHGIAGDCDVLAVAACGTRANRGRPCELPEEGAGAGLWVGELRKLQPWLAQK